MIARGERPRESLCQALGCVFICGAVAMLIMLVFYLLISAVTALFAAGIHWEITNQLNTTAFAVSALLAAPFLLFSFLPDQDTPQEKFSGLRKVLSYVILPAYLLLLAVLLGYIATIIVKLELPVGRLNLWITGKKERIKRKERCSKPDGLCTSVHRPVDTGSADALGIPAGAWKAGQNPAIIKL